MDQPSLPNLEAEKPVDPPADPTKPAETVSQDLYEKFKADAKTYQDQLKAAQSQLEEMKLSKLKESKNWQEIARLKEEEATKSKEDAENLRKAIVNQQKSIALRSAAVKSGMDPRSMDDLDLFDFDEIVVETTSTGKILVNGADAAILKLKTLRPHWFLKNPSAVNPSSPEVKPTSGAVTLETLSTLEKEYKKNPMNLAAKRAYEEGIRKFKA